MQDNPYAPPTAKVTDAEPATQSRSEPAFFPTSVVKMLVLSFGTLGLYQYYWFYKNWQCYKQRTQENILPAARAFFAVVFCYALFQKINDRAASTGASSFPAGLLAAAWIVSSLLWKLPDPYWLVIYLAVFALLPVQLKVNDINAKIAPDHDRNTRFTAWNWAAVIIGLPMFALVLMGAFTSKG